VIGVATGGVFDVSVSGVRLQFETGGFILSAGSDEVPTWANTGQLSEATTAKALPMPTASRRTLRTAPSCDLTETSSDVRTPYFKKSRFIKASSAM
jgi:hypothetical protein